MNVLSVRRRIARKAAASVDYVERAIAAAARALQPTGVLAPITVVVDRQKGAGPRD